MIQMQSNLDVADNSGAKRVQCIKVLGGSKRRTASVGDIIVVSIKEAQPRGKVKKGDVHRAVIVRTAKDIHRADGSTIERGGAGQQERGADRHPYLRPGSARVAWQEAHEDHQPRAGGAVMAAAQGSTAKAKMRIKKGDQVIVLSGKDKGKTGTVTLASPKDQKVIVGGVNVATRHRKPSQANPQGGLEKIEAPLHVSKVSHVTRDGKPTRVRFEVQDGQKIRVAVKTGEKIDG